MKPTSEQKRLQFALRVAVAALVLSPLASEAQMTLEVRLADLSTSLVNKTATSYSIDGYQIQSLAGTLDPASWNSLADQGIPGWTEVVPSALNLTELNVSSFTLWSPGTKIGIGFPFGTSLSEFETKPRDATFTFTQVNGRPMLGVVEYIAVPEPSTLLSAALAIALVSTAARRARF